MDVSRQFSDLMMAFGEFFTFFTEQSFQYYGMEISVRAILVWMILAVVVIRAIMR